VLELKNGKRPPFSFAGAWLWADDKPLVGLIQFAPYVNEYLATGVPSIS
jgi:hypothetical protein